MKMLTVACALTLGVLSSTTYASEAEKCQTYCKAPASWHADLKYTPRDTRCGRRPSIEAKGKLRSIFSLVGRDSKCQDRSNPAVALPSDFKPASKKTVRVNRKAAQLFCFSGRGKFSRTKYFTYKRTGSSRWGNGIGCFQIVNTSTAMPLSTTSR